MTAIDPNAWELAADICDVIDLGRRKVTLFETWGADDQVRGYLLIHAGSMLSPAMRQADPMIESTIRSASRVAGEVMSSWVDSPVPAMAKGETYAEWHHRRYVALENALAGAGALMASAVEMARAGGTYGLFRQALVETQDKVIVALSGGVMTGLCCFDGRGLKVEYRSGVDLEIVRNFVENRHRLTADDLYAVQIDGHGDYVVSAEHVIQAISLVMEECRVRPTERVAVSGPHSGGTITFDFGSLQAALSLVDAFERGEELDLDAMIAASDTDHVAVLSPA